MKIAIIGGSLMASLDGFRLKAEITGAKQERIKTPFGEPSEQMTIAAFDTHEIVYLNRHGHEHHLAPHQINYRANLFALKILEVTHVIAVTVVGGITDEMIPGQWVIPDQLIDYSYGRMQTYNDGNDNQVNHIDFAYPYDEVVRQHLISAINNDGKTCQQQATYGVTQGPRLETAAEIRRMENDGCHIVGMTGMPEAGLAKELDMHYANISLVVNRAAGKENKSHERHRYESGPTILDEIKQHIDLANPFIDDILLGTITRLFNNNSETVLNHSPD